LQGGEVVRYTAPVPLTPISLSPSGQLQVVGGAGADVISMEQTSTHYLVTLNGAQARVSRSLVSGIVLAGGAGDDQITLNLDAERALNVNGGSGNDTLRLLWAPAAGTSLLNLQSGEGTLGFAGAAQGLSHLSVERVDLGGVVPFLASATLEMETRLALVLHFDDDLGTTLSASDLVLRNLGDFSVRPIAEADLALSRDAQGATIATLALPTTLPSAHWRLELAAGAYASGGVASGYTHQVRFAYSQGDVNGNGLTDFADLYTIVQGFGRSVSGRSQGDLNYDGRIGFEDLLAVAQNYNLPYPLPLMSPVERPRRSAATALLA
jgi:hypothetical protein